LTITNVEILACLCDQSLFQNHPLWNPMTRSMSKQSICMATASKLVCARALHDTAYITLPNIFRIQHI